MQSKIVIIGAGFSSISAACYLASQGHEVNVYEKNAQLGGRAQQYQNEGFYFDMGPTWYWMPDVFDRFFNDFGKKTSDYYTIEKLSPAYRVFFGENDFVDIPDNLPDIINVFERIEKGAGHKLARFIDKSRSNYDIAIKKLVYKPGLSPLELVTADTIFELPQFIQTIRKAVYAEFKNPKLRQILEFPVLFLGAKPSDTPLFYNFMNYADFGLGTWYPKGGMKSVVDGMVQLAEELGVRFHTNAEVEGLLLDEQNQIYGVSVDKFEIPADLVLSGADYQFTETLLEPDLRSYSNKYWDKRVMAPSALLFYVGFDKELSNVLHHTLFFDVPFDTHAQDIYDEPMWPKEPLFYASFSSKTDAIVAPEGQEAATFLIPLAPDLEDTPELREQYFDIIMDRMSELTDQELKSHVMFKRSYCVKDFKEDYNSFKGNAYGMANTLFQTAFLRPKLQSKKVPNLYYTGQLTVPGPGVPPALISGKIVSELINKSQKS